MSGRIHAIDRESVHRICSGQVVLDLATAVKELVENSLDAGATFIEIKFKQQGLESLSVSDNGSGITDENLDALALKHYTSKLSDFSDLANVESFGFRGEALSSLCALARLSVTTSTGKSPMGVKVDYNADGMPGPKTPVSFPKGTCVTLTNLFEGMPVRRSEFVKNVKREFSKCLGLIQAYALISTNVRIKCTSLTDKKSTLTHLATTGNASIRQNIVNVFGAKGVTDIVEVDLTLAKPSTDAETGQSSRGVYLKGYISSPDFGKGRASSDRQYIFLNGRPCVLPKIARVINEVYHSFNTNQYPFVVVNLEMPTFFYDVNVSPDKRTIFLHNERTVVEELREKLTEQFEPSRSTFAVREAMIKKPDLNAFKRTVDVSTDQRQDLEQSEEPLVRKRPTALVARSDLLDEQPMGGVDMIVGRTADIQVTERQRTTNEQQQQQQQKQDHGLGDNSELLSKDQSAVAAQQDDMEHGQPTTTTTSSGNKFMIQEITLGSIANGLRSAHQQTQLHKHFTSVVSTDIPATGTKRAREVDEEEGEDVGVASTFDSAQGGKVTVPNESGTATVQKLPGPLSTLAAGKTDATMLDARLDDRADGIASTGVEDSESEGEEEEEELISKTPKDSRVHRVVVLDSEVHQDGDREWIEVTFDPTEQLQKRQLRMRQLKERRRQAEEQEVRASQRRLRWLAKAKMKEEEEEKKKKAASMLEQDTERRGGGGGSDGDEMMVEGEEVDEEEDMEIASGATRRRSRRQQENRGKAKKKEEAGQRLSDASFANTDDAKARQSLSRVISKKDFAQMKVLGQFNKAFIIARLDSTEVVEEEEEEEEGEEKENGGDGAKEAAKCSKATTTRTRSDIFVIDQHASDEKYNFETLQAKTVMSTQRLFQPKPLYLTAQEELTVLDNMEVLNRNGFYLHHDHEAAVSHRLKLLTLPVSERVVFDQSDFEELVFLLAQQEHSSLGLTMGSGSNSGDDGHDSHRAENGLDGSGHAQQQHQQHNHHRSSQPKMVRPSKVRNLFASRACRRSVMIGDVLKVSQMKKIVRHMGEIDQPWNCPHGRPTMRHLLDLSELEQHQQHQRTRTQLMSLPPSSSSAVSDSDGGTTASDLGVPASLWDPIAVKRPTRHRGSLFRQFMATPSVPGSA